MIRISIAEAGKSPQLLTYNASAITLGRLAEHDLCLLGKGVSATHCRLLREGDVYFIEDLGSTNGTYVNRQRVQGRQPIGPTDDVVLAIYRLRVVADTESGASAMPTAPAQPFMTSSADGPMAPTPGMRHGAPTAHMPAPTGPMPMAMSGPSLPPFGPAPSGPSLPGGSPLVSSGAGPLLGSGPAPATTSGAGAGGRGLVSTGGGPNAADMAWGREWEQIDKLAMAWLAAGKSGGELLRGDKLAHARKWLSQGRGKRPPPKPLHRDFILAGARAKTARALGGWMITLLVLAGLGVGGWFYYQQHNVPEVEPDDGGEVAVALDLGGGTPNPVEPGDAKASATLAATAGGLVAEDPVLAVLVAAEAVARLPRDDAALDAPAFTVLRAALRELPGRPLREHAGTVERVALSPDGRWAVTAGAGGADVHLWDLDKPGVLNSSALNGHPRGLTGMKVSQDGRWLVTADADGLAMRWNLLDPDPASTGVRLEDHRVPISALDVSADGHWLVTGDESGQVKVWDLEPQLPSAVSMSRRHEGKVTGVAINDDGTRVVSSGEDMTARNWKLVAGRGKKLVVVPHEEVVVTSVALTPDDRFAVTGGADGVVRLWPPTSTVPTLHWELLPGHKGAVSLLEVSADSSMAVSVAQDNDLWIWDLKAKVPSASSVRLPGHTGRILQLALYSPPKGVAAGRHVPTTAFTASADGTARSWDLDQRKSGAVSRVLPGHDGGVRSVGVSGDGQWAITGGVDRVARIWDWQSLPTSAGSAEDEMPRVGSASRVGRAHTGGVVAVAVDPFGRRMITGSADGTARVWDMRHPTRLVSLPWKDLHTDRVRAVAVATANKWAASGDNAGRLVIWDLQAERPPGRPLAGHSGEIGAVAFTPDGKRVISVSTDRTARVWTLSEDPESDVVVLQHDDEISQLALAGDGRWLLTGTLTGAFLWDLLGALDAPVQTFKGHEDDLKAVALDARGRWAATGSADRKVLLYDLKKDNKLVAKLRQHEGAIQVLAFHPEGRWLASGSEDKSIRLWDLKSAHPDEGSVALNGHAGGITDLEWSPDGRWLVSASNDGTIRLWDTRKPTVEMVEEVIVLEGHALNTVVPQVALVSGERGLSHVVSAGYDGTARLWPLEAAELIGLACTAAGRKLTQDEWLDHVGGKYESSCK
jgi:WD40 repeat protein